MVNGVILKFRPTMPSVIAMTQKMLLFHNIPIFFPQEATHVWN